MTLVESIAERAARAELLGRGLRRHGRLVLAVSLLADGLLLGLLRNVSELSSFRSAVASLLALAGVVSGLVAGPLVALAVSLSAGTLYWIFIAPTGTTLQLVSAMTVVAVWTVAAVLSALVADWFRGQIGERQQRLQEQLDLSDRISRELAERVRLQRALNAIGDQVMRSLDTDEVLRRAVASAGEEFGARWSCIVIPGRDGWAVRWAWNLPEGVHGVELPLDYWPAIRAAMSSLGVSVAFVDDEAVAPPGWHDFVGVRAAVPLVVTGELVGCLVLGFGEVRDFSAAEMDFARALGVRVSQALSNARRYETEREISLTLQQSFLPSLPRLPHLELGMVSRPASTPALVGGDFTDVFDLGDGRVLVVLGDVEGKGVRAATVASIVRSAARALALVRPGPGFILGRLNELVERHDDEQFVTAVVLVLDTATGDASYATAGHQPPLLLRRDDVERLPARAGMPLGSFEGDYPESCVRLGADETLLLYTDGLTEARRDGEQFGEERLLAEVREAPQLPAQRLVEGLATAAERFAGRLQDDVQVLALRYEGVEAPAALQGSAEARAEG
jgi:serine phosphatase RsbU (regulator of sigma subunit)